MKTQKKAALLFLAVVFAAFNGIFFILGGAASPASVWIAYGVMSVSFFAAVITVISNAKNERGFAVLYAYFGFNVIVSACVALIKPSGCTAIIITEIVFTVIWIFLIFTFTSVDKHTVSSSVGQASAVEGIRMQAGRIKALIGVYTNGKLDAKLEGAYDDIRLIPAASAAKAEHLRPELDFAVTALENAVKNEQDEMIAKAFDKLYIVIERIKMA